MRNQDTDCLHVVYDDSSGFICIFLISNRTGEIGPRHLHFRVAFASVCVRRALIMNVLELGSILVISLSPTRSPRAVFDLCGLFRLKLGLIPCLYDSSFIVFSLKRGRMIHAFRLSMNQAVFPLFRVDLNVKGLRKWKLYSSIN